MKFLITIAFLFCITACGTVSEIRTVNVRQPFDGAQAERMIAAGPNTIYGSALMRQRGGGVVTCAGSEIILVPATEYAKQRMASIFGSSNFSRTAVKFQPDVAEYKDLVRKTKCNVQGQFTFEQVADGEFFISSTVVWAVGYNAQGGNMIERVTVKNGQRKEVTLAN